MIYINVNLLQWFKKSFDKKSATYDVNTSGGAFKNEIMSNKQLEEELNKTNVKNRKCIYPLWVTFDVLIKKIWNY